MKQQHKNPLSKKTCKHCGSHFKTTHKSKQYCTEKCQNDAKCARYYKSKKTTQVNRYETKRKKLLATGFGRWLLKECQRAETVQILEGHTVESLNDLFELFKRRSKASGYVDGKPTGAFELSHIWSVKGNKQKMGLLHPQNLVLAPARLNRSHGSKTPSEGFEGIGRYVPTSALLSRFSVSKGDSLAQVERQVFQLLGTTWQQFVATLVIQQGQQEQLRKKIEKTLDTRLPIDLTFEQLKAMAEESGVSYFSANFSAYSAVSVLAKELQRFGHVKGTEYGVYSSWIATYFSEVNSLEGSFLDGLTMEDQVELEQLLVGEVFAILHGQPMPERKAKAQELLFLLVAPQKCIQDKTKTNFSVLEDAEEEETEDWIL
jgi:hypothetical protein